ncbi:hypothetical protein D3C87_2024600 [compost metagenome]
MGVMKVFCSFRESARNDDHRLDPKLRRFQSHDVGQGLGGDLAGDIGPQERLEDVGSSRTDIDQNTFALPAHGRQDSPVDPKP